MTSSPPSKRLLTEEGNRTNVTETEEYDKAYSHMQTINKHFNQEN